MQEAVNATEPVIADLPSPVVKELPIVKVIPPSVVVTETTLKRLAQFDTVKRRVRNLRTEVKNMSKAYALTKAKSEILKLQNEVLAHEIADLRDSCGCRTTD